jgi:Bacterial Ig-like domain/WD40-like Beta Propeller Repeat
LLLVASLLVACDGPPQITAISPERHATSVRTNQPIRISFDRPVDAASVSSRFHLLPAVQGQVGWESPRDLVFTHQPLRPDTDYVVQLDLGYSDQAGHVSRLDHGWGFHTESAPSLLSMSPAAGDRSVDPAALITLTFSRDMDPYSLPAAVAIRPGISPSLRIDPGDGRRVQLAPPGLLEPGTTYTVTVTTEARDVDGNQLNHGVAASFVSGPAQPLHHRITFIAAPAGESAGEGVWMVDESRFARPLAPGSTRTYSWSPDAVHLLVGTSGGAWVDQQVGGARTSLPLVAGWASLLEAGQGYAYLSDRLLRQHRADGTDLQVAAGVREAIVGPDGSRLAYVVPAGPGWEIWAYDVKLRTQYRIQSEAGQISDLAWAPDGSRLAYRLAAAGGGGQIRVRSLSGRGGVATLAAGQVEAPVWQADSRHLVFAALVPLPGGALISKAFRLSVSDPPPQSLTLAMGLPAGPTLAARDPRPSPDGHQIAFLGEAKGTLQIFVMNVDGTGLAQLTVYDPAVFPYSCSDPAWAPG